MSDKDIEQGSKSPRSKSPLMGVSGLIKELSKNVPTTSTSTAEGERRTSSGILKLDPTKPRRRSSATSVELRNEDPASPCPSDRLSVTWADGEKSVSSDTSVTLRGKQEMLSENPSIITLQPASGPMSPTSLQSPLSPMSPSTPNKEFLRDPHFDQELGSSVSMILQRSSSMRTSKRKSRRKSTMTSTSSGDTAINLEEEAPEEKVKLYNEVLAGVKHQPWPMKKKLYLARLAKDFLVKHEGELEERLAQSSSTKDVLYHYFIRFRRVMQMAITALYNWFMSLELWEGRVKRIESHFGSAVASYFTFIRWVMGLNFAIAILLAAFVIIPEVLAGNWTGSGERKHLLKEEKYSAYDLKTIWDFGGILRYSPIFYGFYGNTKSTKEGYMLPLAYILTSMCVYGYSFVAILRKMAANSRMSKLGDDDATVFTFRLFASWDFTIGNTEAAQNKVASINMGFRESLVEAREADREEKNWRITAKRSLAHFLVICLFLGSAYAVILLVDRSREVTSESSWWRQNELTVILALISQLFPNLFDAVGILESHHPRKQLQWQLARIMGLNLLNLYTLIFALFGKVNDMSTELVLMKEELKETYNMSTFWSTDLVEELTTIVPIMTDSVNDSLSSGMAVATTVLLGFGLTSNSTNTSSPLNSTDLGLNFTTTAPIQCRKIRIPCSESPTVKTPKNDSLINSLNSYKESTVHSVVPSNETGEELILDILSPFTASLLNENDYNGTYGNGMLGYTNMSRNLTDNFEISNSSTIPTDNYEIPNLSTTPTENYKISNVTETEIWDTTVETAIRPSLVDYSSTTSDIHDFARYDHTTLSATTKTPETTTSGPYIGPDFSELSGAAPDGLKPFLALFPFPPLNDNSSLGISSRKKRSSDPLTTEELRRIKRNDTITEELKNDTSSYLVHPYDISDEILGIPNYTNSTLVDENNNPPTPSYSINNTNSIGYDYVNYTFDGLTYENTTELNFTETELHTMTNNFSDFLTSSPLSVSSTLDTNATSNFSESLPVIVSPTDLSLNETKWTEYNDITGNSSKESSKIWGVNFTDSMAENENKTLEFTTIEVPTTTNITYNTDEYPHYFDNSFGLNNDCFIVNEVCDEENSSKPLDLNSTYLNETENVSFSNDTEQNSTVPSSEQNNVQDLPSQKEVPQPLSAQALVEQLPPKNRTYLRKLCWETMFGQEIVKLTVMDMVITVLTIVVGDYIRAVIVRLCNRHCCWDLEKQCPGYPDFKIAENILHLVNNQGLVWMGMFFSPGLPALNLVKLLILFYVRSWAVVTSNVPPETVFKASDNNNFYLALLLTMLFLCTLPVGYAVVWLTPSWHCGPFSDNKKIYQLATETLISSLPDSFEPIIDYISSPGVVIPGGVLLILIIYYLVSLTAALREAVQDLKDQLRRERNAEKQKALEARDAKKVETPASKWSRLIQLTPMIPQKFDLKRSSEQNENDKVPLLGDSKQKQPISSPPLDDTTDPGHSEVFDDSLSEPKKAKQKIEKIKDVASTTQNQSPVQRQVSLVRDDKKRRDSKESSGGSLPRSPRMKTKYHHSVTKEPKEESPSKMTQTYKFESPKTREDHRKRGSKEYYKDSPKRVKSSGQQRQVETDHPDGQDRISRASQEIEKITEEYPELADTYDGKTKTDKLKKLHKKGPLSPEKTDGKEDSPQRQSSGHKHRREKSIHTMSDVHNGLAKGGKKRESSKKQKKDRDKDKEDKPTESPEMQTIPVIKISKEDSVERSIEKAKLERQSQTANDDEDSPKVPHIDRREATIPPKRDDNPQKLLETDIDEPIYQTVFETEKTEEKPEEIAGVEQEENQQQPESRIVSPEIEKEIAFADATDDGGDDATVQVQPPRVEPPKSTTEDTAITPPRYRSRKPPELTLAMVKAEERQEPLDEPQTPLPK